MASVENPGDVKALINYSESEAAINSQSEKENLTDIALESGTKEGTSNHQVLIGLKGTNEGYVEKINENDNSEMETRVRAEEKQANITKISEIESETAQKVSLPKYSNWDFNEIVFPNFSTSESVISIPAPNKKCVPGHFNLSLSEYRFEKKLYINTKKEKRERGEKREEEIENLKFSFSEIMTNARKCGKSCKNWAEYKKGVKQKEECWDRSHDLPHLYADGLQPLVKPELATSTG